MIEMTIMFYEAQLKDMGAKKMAQQIRENAKKDAINPDHYKIGGIETIDYLEAKMTPEQFEGFCVGNALKYISRAGHKNDAAEDYRKAIWYLERLLTG